MRNESEKTFKIFYCYAREDKALRNELDAHLSLLKRQNLVIVWSDREISPGAEWEKEIHSNLNFLILFCYWSILILWLQTIVMVSK